MAEPPVVDRLDTRLLEERRVVRTFVHRAEVAEADETGVLLRTVARASRRHTSSPPPTLAGRRPDVSPPPTLAGRRPDVSPPPTLAGRRPDVGEDLPGEGDEIDGVLRVDVLGDGMLRVRYAEGAEVPENPTPMVVGWPDGPSRCDVETADDGVVLRTPELVVELDLRPVVLRVRDAEGRELCEIGGREKNGFNLWDSFNTGISRTVPDGRPVATETFSLRSGEAIYGLGERFTSLDHVGSTVDVDMREATGTSTPRAYKNVPLFLSTRGYGVFVNMSSRMTLWVGSRQAADVQLACADDLLDYVVIAGDLPAILDRYTDLTGKPEVPPRWSFGFWQSKISYGSSDEVREVVRGMREAGVPMDVLNLDTNWFREDWRCDLEFSPERFPDPAGLMRELHEEGVRICLWQLPYIPEGSELFRDLLEAGAFVKTISGDLYDVGICYTPGFDGRVGCVDWTNPAATDVYRKHLGRLFEAGASVIKVDFGEQAPLDGVYHDGTPGHRMHNLYPLLYNRAIAELTEELAGERVIWARSAWAGSQRYPLHWGGDSTANWHSFQPQFRGGLSFGLSGFPFWSQDIGGFIGRTGGELLVRWLQAGLFLSHARIHGFGERELFRFSGETLRIGRDLVRLRYRLLPYLWGEAHRSARRSLPMMRPLVLEHQDDPTTYRIDDQWLLGDVLLVAPLFGPGGRRRVYLPEGTWTDWWTGGRRRGPAWHAVETPLELFPLLVREGGVVALGPEMDHVDQVPTDALELRVAPFTEDGAREALVGVGEDLVRVTYEAAGGDHVVRVGPSGARFSVVPLGDDPPEVRLVTDGPSG